MSLSLYRHLMYILVTHHNVATDETEFEKKQLERIKIFPQKRERVSGIDSPTLREIANQNAKRLRVDGEFSFILWSLQILFFHKRIPKLFSFDDSS